MLVLQVLIIGVRDQFCLGGGGGWGQLPKYLIHCLPENQVVLPEYYMIFARKLLFEKILGGCMHPHVPMVLIEDNILSQWQWRNYNN